MAEAHGGRRAPRPMPAPIEDMQNITISLNLGKNIDIGTDQHVPLSRFQGVVVLVPESRVWCGWVVVTF
jgi:hypothetical protein